MRMKVYFTIDQLIDGAVEQLRSEPAIFQDDSENRGLPPTWKRFVANVGEGIEIVVGTMQFASISEANISIVDRRTNRCQVCLFNDEDGLTAVDVIKGSTKPIALSDEVQAVFGALYKTVIAAFNQPFSFDAEDEVPAVSYGMTG
jgi:hypothetical protein